MSIESDRNYHCRCPTDELFELLFYIASFNYTVENMMLIDFEICPFLNKRFTAYFVIEYNRKRFIITVNRYQQLFSIIHNGKVVQMKLGMWEFFDCLRLIQELG